MPSRSRVLLVGGTGRTGSRVLEQLLDRGAQVRVIVRSQRKLPKSLLCEPALEVVEADLLSLGEDDLLEHVRGCDAVISCLGHTIDPRGIFGPPRDLVTKATKLLCCAIIDSRPERPVRLVLMSSVSVNHPEVREARRTASDRLVLWVLRGVLPPAKDNQTAANYLHRTVGKDSQYMEWVAVRPDTLLPGAITQYAVHETLVSSLFKPSSTNMANVASFMCDLALCEEIGRAWAGKLPVIVNAPLAAATASAGGSIVAGNTV